MELSFKNLPFVPEASQVIYVESSYDEKINKYIQENYEWLVKEYGKCGFSFCYLPLLAKETIRYNAPHIDVDNLMESYKIPSLSDYAIDRKDIAPGLCFAVNNSVPDDNGTTVLQYIRFCNNPYEAFLGLGCENRLHIKNSQSLDESEKTSNGRDSLFSIIKEDLCGLSDDYDNYGDFDYYTDAAADDDEYRIQEKPNISFWNISRSSRSSIRNSESIDIEADEDINYGAGSSFCYHNTSYADDNFDTESKKLIDEIRHRINLLKNRGVNTWILKELIEKENPVKLSRIRITKKYKIFLVDYNNVEVVMGPLPKALYILFLRHAEGIKFKEISDYYEELMGIYKALYPNRSTDVKNKSIQKITDPLDNSINEKCARIREAFINIMDESIAQNYFVTGQRGEAKKITLDRNLIIWE